MIQLKATCLQCGGMGFISDAPICPDCDGKGAILLTSEKWDISLERVPPFSLEEMEEMRKK